MAGHMVPVGAEVGHLYDSPNDGVIVDDEFRQRLRRTSDNDVVRAPRDSSSGTSMAIARG